MARKTSRRNKPAEQDAMQGQRPHGPNPASKAAKCNCGNPVCADQWHRLGRWLEEEDRANSRKLEAWVKAIWDEDPEADRTFEAAPGLSLVWSGAKIEEQSLRMSMARRTSEANKAAKVDAGQRQCPTEEGAKPGALAQPSDESVDKCVEAFFDDFDSID